MLRGLGLSPALLRSGDLDGAYLSRVRELRMRAGLDKLVLLAHDHVHDTAGRPRPEISPIYVPNDYVLGAARRFDDVVAAVSIHPARPDALDELERCIAGGARVLKLLPNCHDVDCRLAKFGPFWERMAKARMIFLAHTGGELALPVVDAALETPAVLTAPLEAGVTVIAAHCGTSSHALGKNYTKVFFEMLGRFPNLYGDNSGMNTPFRAYHLKELAQPEYRERIVHGSDLPIPVAAVWLWLRRMIPSSAYLELRRLSNPLELDVRIKEALGFAPETFTRMAKLLEPGGVP